MPVYEFYCPDCHVIFNFFSRRVDTETCPACPRCGRPRLGRQASLFAIGGGRGEGEDPAGDGLPPGVDENRLMNAFASLAGELEHLDQDDPRQAARTMRRLFEATGMRLGDDMAEAIRRMEAGEDPDQIESDLGDVLDQENLFGDACLPRTGEAIRQLRRELLPAARDDSWYPLHGSPGAGAGG